MERMPLHPGDGEHVTLNDVRAFLREHMRGEGAVCPACEQVVKVYKRSLNSNMARQLITAYREFGTEWFHAPTRLPSRDGTGDLAKLRHWGLVEEDLERRPDGGRAGFWSVTVNGALFARNLMTVQKYVLLYNARLVGLDGPQIRVTDALGTRFDYNELMRS